MRAEYPSQLDYSGSCLSEKGVWALPCKATMVTCWSQAMTPAKASIALAEKHLVFGFEPLDQEPLGNSATGTRTRVARVRAEYPSQLDYSGSCFS